MLTIKISKILGFATIGTRPALLLMFPTGVSQRRIWVGRQLPWSRADPPVPRTIKLLKYKRDGVASGRIADECRTCAVLLRRVRRPVGKFYTSCKRLNVANHHEAQKCALGMDWHGGCIVFNVPESASTLNGRVGSFLASRRPALPGGHIDTP
jgi:hypothetical protein